MTNDLILTTVGFIFLLLSVAIIRIQSCAGRCPRHTRTAGILAWVLAGVCAAIGLSVVTLVQILDL